MFIILEILKFDVLSLLVDFKIFGMRGKYLLRSRDEFSKNYKNN